MGSFIAKATCFISLNLALLSSASPTTLRVKGISLHQRDYQSLISFVNGSWLMLPKCNVLGCGQPANSSRHSNAALRKRVVDQTVDKAFDISEEEMFQLFTRNNNVWNFVVSHTPNRRNGPFFVPLQLQHGQDVRSVLEVHDLGRGDIQGIEAVDYLIAPWIFREFGGIHSDNPSVTDARRGNRVEDYLHLEQALDPAFPEVQLDRRLFDEIQSARNLLGADTNALRIRNRGYAGEPIDLERLGLTELNRMFLGDSNAQTMSTFNTQADRFSDILNAVYPNSDPRIGFNFRVYARSVREIWLLRLRAEVLRLHNAQQDLPPLPQSPAPNPPNPAPAPPANNPPNAAPLPPGIETDPELGDWGLQTFLPTGNLPNLDTDTEYIRQAWFSEVAGPSSP